MDEKHVELLRSYIDAKVDPLTDDIKEVKSDVKDLKAFKWKITGVAIAASSFAGSATFSIAKFLDKMFAG